MKAIRQASYPSVDKCTLGKWDGMCEKGDFVTNAPV